MALVDEGKGNRLTGAACLAISFLAAALYVVIWLRCVTEFGTGVVVAGELSMTLTAVATALLCVCGVLWFSLVILGGCVMIAVTVLNGVWIYRLR